MSLTEQKILSFDFKAWVRENRLALILLTVLVSVAYLNSLGNGFVADDVYALTNNKHLDEFDYVFTNPLGFIRPLMYYIINQLFGLTPAFYRIVGVLSHLGAVLVTYLLVSLLIDAATAVFAASLFAVHPILTESVTWISAGYYPQYGFFLLLALLLYILSLKNSLFYFFSILSFAFALFTSEKAAVFPFILLAFFIAFKEVFKDWKKLIIPFAIGGSWILIYAKMIPQRVATLQAAFYQAPQTTNPLAQIPIAITSYLELIFWPKSLTLYHSEMSFSSVEFYSRLIVFLIFLGLVFWTYRKNKTAFFWLSLFVVSLLPMLTPFGISWIVAERYVYLGAVGILVIIAITTRNVIDKITEKITNKIGHYLKWDRSVVFYVTLVLLLLPLTARTIVRNNDWKTQDTLWLAAAKTSPASPQNHNNLGDLYGRRGDLVRSAEEFKKAIELKPGYADAYHNLANTYHQMGRVDEAIENYQKAIEFNPLLWQSHQNLAAIYFEQEEFELAKEQMEKAVEINPENTNLRRNLEVIYLRLEKSSILLKNFNAILT